MSKPIIKAVVLVVVIVIVFVKKKLGPTHFSQKILGCPKIIKVKKSLIQKTFGRTNFLVQHIFLRQKSKNIQYEIIWSKNFWVKGSFFFKINVGPQKLRTQKNWVPTFLSKLGL